jgi:hypothetical protein
VPKYQKNVPKYQNNSNATRGRKVSGIGQEMDQISSNAYKNARRNISIRESGMTGGFGANVLEIKREGIPIKGGGKD